VALDYVQLYMRGTEHWGSVQSVLSICFLTVARMAPVIALSPFFGARILPNPVKIGMLLCFLAMIIPKLIFTITTPLQFNFTLLALVSRELLIGAIFGFFLGLPFLIVSSTGVYVDHQRGGASLMTNDPTIQNQTSPLGTVYNMTLIVVFWGLGGPIHVLNILFDSYDLVPPDKWIAPLFLAEHSLLHERVIHALFIFAALSIQLAMPALLAVLMTDTFLGIANRLAPHVQITFLGMGLKSWFALLIVCLGFLPFVTQLGKQIESWLRDFKEIVYECRYPDKPEKIEKAEGEQNAFFSHYLIR
jgi:type III secretion protein SpaR/YscT/HrcT